MAYAFTPITFQSSTTTIKACSDAVKRWTDMYRISYNNTISVFTTNAVPTVGLQKGQDDIIYIGLCCRTSITVGWTMVTNQASPIAVSGFTISTIDTNGTTVVWSSAAAGSISDGQTFSQVIPLALNACHGKLLFQQNDTTGIPFATSDQRELNTIILS